MEKAIIASLLIHPEKAFAVQLPIKAPATVIRIFPRKKAQKNLMGLYFKSPKGMTTGSSGMVLQLLQKVRKKPNA